MGDQPAMLAQQGIRRRNRGDLPRGRSADSMGPRRQASAIIIGETQQPPSITLAPKKPVLFDEVRDGFPLAAI